MKEALLAVVRCPACGGPLTLDPGAARNGDDVVRGRLTCGDCRAGWPIERYVPRFIAGWTYSTSWGKLWGEVVDLTRDSATGLTFHRDVIHGEWAENQGLQPGKSPFGFAWPTRLEGQRILEVGAGTGCCTEHLVATGADVIAMDMSSAIDTFPEELLRKPNLNVFQADITSPVLASPGFDRIWLFQVLQHTPSPPATLRVMRRLLRSGGELAFTSYGGAEPFNPWWYRFTRCLGGDFGWRLLGLTLPVLVPLKNGLYAAATRLGLPRVARFTDQLLGLVDPRNIWRRVVAGEMDDYPFGASWRRTGDRRLLMRYVLANTFDAITPVYTNNASHETIERWTREAGFSAVRTWGTGGVRAVAVA